MTIRLININEMSSQDLNELTSIYVSDASLSPSKMVEILQQRVACRSLHKAIKLIQQDHRRSCENSLSQRAKKLEELRKQAESLHAYPRAISAPNPSYFLAMNTVKEDLEFAESQVRNHQKSISRLNDSELEFKSVLRTSSYWSGSLADSNKIEEILNEMGIKELMQDLEKRLRELQEQVKNFSLELTKFSIVTVYGESRVEDFQYQNGAAHHEIE
ncbi:MAG: hypothetical protein EWV92_06720 [Microcystis aeruginosa Ma_MB_S_20031200_S102]|uniref:Uncharacterized protein n=1 Tax=Microcystis aeruginosa Ma_MB_S_20031200_S102 TaxID=2486254 RepID=A0A552EXE1_MICAE|nr:MAG: hypothetical protein EWV79_01025 [Microcystis aeruginosa Ma_MB_S_20031200_S102D]TRU39142.1 MAG: hypothetical protein EWV92_06720 [Microcystis aeruginosa Ma_MB_S_20031200_S102]